MQGKQRRGTVGIYISFDVLFFDENYFMLSFFDNDLRLEDNQTTKLI